MIIKYVKQFSKSFNKLDHKIRVKFWERVSIFKADPFDQILNNHALVWKLKWKRSINVTWDFRAIFKEYPNWTYEFVEFIDIWTHSELYD
jgi:mRNA-degrading endonuclease YafQ of YafQ-DinJ toxin-antitoxin module